MAADDLVIQVAGHQQQWYGDEQVEIHDIIHDKLTVLCIEY